MAKAKVVKETYVVKLEFLDGEGGVGGGAPPPNKKKTLCGISGVWIFSGTTYFLLQY